MKHEIRSNDKNNLPEILLNGMMIFVIAFLLGFAVGLACGVIHFDIHRPRG